MKFDADDSPELVRSTERSEYFAVTLFFETP